MRTENEPVTITIENANAVSLTFREISHNRGEKITWENGSWPFSRNLLEKQMSNLGSDDSVTLEKRQMMRHDQFVNKQKQTNKKIRNVMLKKLLF